MNKIILIGYMGVGKSTIAQLLAETLHQKWIDLDNLIEKNEQLSIKELFRQKGEIYFRKIEHETFEKIIQNNEKYVISTGGGTPCYANNHMFLSGNASVSIYLKGTIDFIFNRLQNERNHRPVLSNFSNEELKEFIAKNLFERSYFYNQADFKIDVEGKTPQLIVEEILKLLA